MSLRTATVHLLSLSAEPDFELLGALRFRHEAQQPLSFLGQGIAIVLRQRSERLDLKGSLSSSPLFLPRSIQKAVDEHGAAVPTATGRQGHAAVIGDDAGAVGVGEQYVVILWQKAGWGGGFGVGQWRAWHVEQLLPVFVTERAQVWPETPDHLAEPAQARPVLTSPMVVGPNASR